MIRDYDVIFKLPCEKVFTFNILISGDDDYDPTTEVGNHPSQHMLDYFLYYVSQLQDYSGSEISNGTVVSVRQKIDVRTENPSVNDDAENEFKNEPEEATPSLKSLYWKNGYIVKARGNGYGIISNDVIFYKEGSTHKSDLDDSLMDYFLHSNDIIEVWDNAAICAFNPYNTDDVRRCCRLVWTRFVEMSREEIEKKLNIPKGLLVIKD